MMTLSLTIFVIPRIFHQLPGIVAERMGLKTEECAGKKMEMKASTKTDMYAAVGILKLLKLSLLESWFL